MRTSLTIFGVWLLLSCMLAAEQSVELKSQGKKDFVADFSAAGRLDLDVRSGDVSVRGIEDNQVRVRFEGRSDDEIKDVKVSFKVAGNNGVLKVTGGPRNNFRIRIEIPKRSDLKLRVSAGEVSVEDLIGDKDVEMWAGDLTMRVGDTSDYGKVDASVRAGDLDMGPFGVSKSGLFRSYQTTGSGTHRLHVHVTAGDVELRN
jgi:Putative adhesin